MSAERIKQPWLGPAALVLFAGIPCFLLSWTLVSGLTWLDANAAIERDSERLVQIEQRIRNASVAKAPQLNTAAIFLSAASPSLARAELQTCITTMVDRVGGRLFEVRAEDEVQGSDPNSVLVRFTFDAVHVRLFDLLTTIEAGLPLLWVEALNIRVQQGRDGETNAEDPTLRVSLSVRAYRQEARP